MSIFWLLAITVGIPLVAVVLGGGLLHDARRGLREDRAMQALRAECRVPTTVVLNEVGREADRVWRDRSVA